MSNRKPAFAMGDIIVVDLKYSGSAPLIIVSSKWDESRKEFHYEFFGLSEALQNHYKGKRYGETYESTLLYMRKDE